MPSTRKQQKAKSRRSREADIMSDLKNMDVMLGSPHFNEMDTENRSLKENSELREGFSNENEIRTYNRSTDQRSPDTSETLQRKLEAIASVMN